MIRYFGVSLEKLLGLGVLKGAKVLGGSAGITNRVTKVNVMEVPDIIEWVSEGELLITTAYSIKDNIEVLLELIPKFKAKGVVGLGIKVGRYVQELPGSVIELADKLGFPILEVPFCVSHTDVISAILTEVINEQMDTLIKIEKFNKEVLDIMIQGGGLKEIANKLYDNIGNSLAIYENMNDSYILFGSNNFDGSMLDKIIHEHANKKKNTEYALRAVSTDNVGDKYLERVTIPIIIEKIEYGSIFIWLDQKALSHFDHMLIESYVHIIALEFVKRLALRNMESNYKLDFLNDLLSDNKDRQNRSVEKANIFNFRKELKHTVIIILLKQLLNSDKLTYKKANYSKGCINRLLTIIVRITKLSNEKVIYAEKNDRILIVYEDEASKEDIEIKKGAISFCEKILNEATKFFDISQLSIGLGRCFKGVDHLWKSSEQAKLIVENLAEGRDKIITHYDDLGLYRIFSYNGLQNELMEFCSETIKPLVDYDKVNNTELVKTLKTYFQCNGNVKEMSRKLYMHYNTMIYRLQKIKEVIRLDMDDYENRLNLEMALKIMDSIKI